jgi:hypothetical protein
MRFPARSVVYAAIGVAIGTLVVAAVVFVARNLDGTTSFVLLAIGIFVSILLVVWLGPRYQARRWHRLKLAPKDAVELEDKARATIVQLIGGLGLIAAVAITLYQLNDARQASERTLRLTEEGQASERFTRAIDQLGALDARGKPLIEVRLGGISELGRFAGRSEADRSLVGEILAAYIRTNARLAANWRSSKVAPTFLTSECGSPPGRPGDAGSPIRRPREDISRALSVLRTLFPASEGKNELGVGRRPLAFDFGGTDLERANLFGLDLRSASLRNALIRSANFTKANLEFAELGDVDARCAGFEDAVLRSATIGGTSKPADFRYTDFGAADLSGVSVVNTDFRRANFAYADLTAAGIERADFRGAYFVAKGFEGATIFEGATFRRVRVDKAAPAGFGK